MIDMVRLGTSWFFGSPLNEPLRPSCQLCLRPHKSCMAPATNVTDGVTETKAADSTPDNWMKGCKYLSL